MAKQLPTKRRTQKERREETRRRLLDATVDCLLQYGYAGMTTTMISERAGVSRGAQLHHFPKKAELVQAAIDYTFDRRLHGFREAMAKIPSEEDRISAAIDLLWEAYLKEDTFYACLEFIVAARTDPELYIHMSAIEQRIRKGVEQTFRELFIAEIAENPFLEDAPRFAMIFMDGLAIGRLGGKSNEEVREMLELIKKFAILIRRIGLT